MRKVRFTNRGFAKIRRGFREHLWRMSSDAVKLYLWLHLVAFWSGKRQGTIETSYAEIAKELRWSIIRVARGMAALQRHYVKVPKRGSQHQYTLIRILKYNKRTKSAPITGDRSNDRSSDRSSSLEANKTLANRVPKKAVEGSRSKAAAAFSKEQRAALWTQTGISPCGDPAFQQLVETSLANQNGTMLSVVMGTVADAREALGLKVPAAFFRRLSEVRRLERNPKTAANDSPSHPSNELTERGAQRLKEYGLVQ